MGNRWCTSVSTGRRTPSIVSRMSGEESVDETGVGDEPPMRTTVGFVIAALVLASLLSACAAGWPPPPRRSTSSFRAAGIPHTPLLGRTEEVMEEQDEAF
jgi:hypothetical protein